MGVTTSTCIYTICIWPRMSRMLSLQPFTATDEEVVMLHTAFSVMKSCKGCLVALKRMFGEVSQSRAGAQVASHLIEADVGVVGGGSLAHGPAHGLVHMQPVRLLHDFQHL